MKNSDFSYDSRQRGCRTPRKRHLGLQVVAIAFVLAAAIGSCTVYAHSHNSSKSDAASKTTDTTIVKSAPNKCAGNSGQLILVSISARHMWACSDAITAYNSPVVTGMEILPADLTPPGTYHIYGKQTDLTLRGTDSTGSWSDPVSYWMPFLDNQYGAYGFHDATWRSDSDFGNISPYSSNASHGCVELPLATAKWLYGWASIGTTVQIVA